MAADDLEQAGEGAAKGAATGATIGGPWGAAAGAAIGGLSPFIAKGMSSLFGLDQASDEEKQAMARLRGVAEGAQTPAQLMLAAQRANAQKQLASLAARGNAQQQAGQTRMAMQMAPEIQQQQAAQLAALRSQEQRQANVDLANLQANVGARTRDYQRRLQGAIMQGGAAFAGESMLKSPGAGGQAAAKPAMTDATKAGLQQIGQTAQAQTAAAAPAAAPAAAASQYQLDTSLFGPGSQRPSLPSAGSLQMNVAPKAASPVSDVEDIRKMFGGSEQLAESTGGVTRAFKAANAATPEDVRSPYFSQDTSRFGGQLGAAQGPQMAPAPKTLSEFNYGAGTGVQRPGTGSLAVTGFAPQPPAVKSPAAMAVPEPLGRSIYGGTDLGPAASGPDMGFAPITLGGLTVAPPTARRRKRGY